MRGKKFLNYDVAMFLNPLIQITYSPPQISQAESLVWSCYQGSGMYYRGDMAGSEVCVRDCNPTSKFIVTPPLKDIICTCVSQMI